MPPTLIALADRSALAFRLKPIRTVQSQAKKSGLPTRRKPVALRRQSQFPSNTARVIASLTRCVMKKVGWSSILVAAMLLAVAVVADAQEPKKVPRIGFLVPAPIRVLPLAWRHSGMGCANSAISRERTLRSSTDGPKVNSIGSRCSQPSWSGFNVDVIVTSGDAAIRAAKDKTSVIPIVVSVAGDLVVPGYVSSHARPGGNITGLIDISPELSTKRLELLKETFPKLSRMAILWNAANPVMVLNFKEIERTARAMDLAPDSLEVRNSADFDRILSAPIKGKTYVLIVLQDSLVIAHSKRIVDYAAKHRLPGMYFDSSWVSSGGLMSYGPNYPDLFRRASTYVDKILKGRKPADLPVEQPMKFEFVINLKTAKQIGLTIPPNVLARADRVIK
jgi:putative tryptophan/tyrosine transport system substrate-binding protein